VSPPWLLAGGNMVVEADTHSTLSKSQDRLHGSGGPAAAGGVVALWLLRLSCVVTISTPASCRGFKASLKTSL
jgi:hypothetical protein